MRVDRLMTDYDNDILIHSYEGSLKPMKESTAEKALARLRDMIPFLQPPNKNKMGK